MASSREPMDPLAPAATSLITATHGLAPNHISAAANISIREYIYFLPYPLPPGTPIPYSIGLPNNNPLNLPPHQFEPTSTLVLTSPNRTFVDIRFYKPSNADVSTTLPNEGERKRLEWAFAGTSESQPISLPQDSKPSNERGDGEEKTWEGVTHSKWTHWLDSRHPVGSPDIPVDEGDMYPIADDLTLEHGHAFQPLMHAHKTHEEMWRDLTIQSTNSSGTHLCVVLRLHADAAGVRGVIVRLGQYCQGIVMQRDYCTVERWEYFAEGRRDLEEATKWKRTARVGDQFLPCAATFRPEVLAMGGLVKYHDYEWVVEEIWEWK
ncbi:uncharacterized protein K460DRAFT_370193 [Cucurbitaria berberidis CBS 394.84]|uniref:Protein HRI1 n=1 Tax=Cucurbitaria berberidis CBS 394.84 TaxID=1168544 RepID=A0A9P4L5D5_9PLEO|nr:uncharacterized protein K460DRAFT_370193 [Cucurbitaria berberidis CBS 394.84]KAF1842209.1 hypothetical protein K460DRAFT_370193 [Cucurbitaria berberidis CBS 394.84]